jgi:alkyl hydroperoxide reductase subunit AhpF
VNIAKLNSFGYFHFLIDEMYKFVLAVFISLLIQPCEYQVIADLEASSQGTGNLFDDVKEKTDKLSKDFEKLRKERKEDASIRTSMAVFQCSSQWSKA